MEHDYTKEYVIEYKLPDDDVWYEISDSWYRDSLENAISEMKAMKISAMYRHVETFRIVERNTTSRVVSIFI